MGRHQHQTSENGTGPAYSTRGAALRAAAAALKPSQSAAARCQPAPAASSCAARRGPAGAASCYAQRAELAPAASSSNPQGPPPSWAAAKPSAVASIAPAVAQVSGTLSAEHTCGNHPLTSQLVPQVASPAHEEAEPWAVPERTAPASTLEMEECCVGGWAWRHVVKLGAARKGHRHRRHGWAASGPPPSRRRHLCRRRNLGAGCPVTCVPPLLASLQGSCAMLGSIDALPPGDIKLVLAMRLVARLWMPGRGEIAEVG